MPTFRTIGADEAATWQTQPKAPKPHDDRYAWAERPAVLFVHGRERALTCAPRVGDVLRLRAAEGTAAEKITGVVLAIWLGAIVYAILDHDWQA